MSQNQNKSCAAVSETPLLINNLLILAVKSGDDLHCIILKALCSIEAAV